jgi:hypothetical protein
VTLAASRVAESQHILTSLYEIPLQKPTQLGTDLHGKPPAVERLKGLLHRQARLGQKPLDPFLMTQLPLALNDLLEILFIGERLAAGHLRQVLIAGQHPGKVQLPQTLRQGLVHPAASCTWRSWS